MNSVWIVNGTNLVYYTNIGYFPSQFPVVEKYNYDNGVCDDSYTSYHKYYNFHSAEFLQIISILGGIGENGNVLIFLVHVIEIPFVIKLNLKPIHRKMENKSMNCKDVCYLLQTQSFL